MGQAGAPKLLKHPAHMPRKAHGFSLVELLVVMALVLIMYAAMYGPGSASGQAKRRAQCARQLQQMHQLLTLFAGEHDGAFPTATGPTSEAALSQLVPLYTTDTSVFICPGSGHAALPGAQPFADRRCSYAYCAGLKRDADPAALLVADALSNTRAKLEGDTLFSTSGSAPGNNHRTSGGHVLFVDGHVEAFGPVASRAFPLPPGSVLLNPKR